MAFAVRHRHSELVFFKPVLTLLIITVLIRELLQPCMIRSVSYGEYCQGNVNEGWQLPLQQPSGELEPRLIPQALAAHQGDPHDATGKGTAQSHTDTWPKEPWLRHPLSPRAARVHLHHRALKGAVWGE